MDTEYQNYAYQDCVLWGAWPQVQTSTFEAEVAAPNAPTRDGLHLDPLPFPEACVNADSGLRNKVPNKTSSQNRGDTSKATTAVYRCLRHLAMTTTNPALLPPDDFLCRNLGVGYMYSYVYAVALLRGTVLAPASFINDNKYFPFKLRYWTDVKGYVGTMRAKGAPLPVPELDLKAPGVVKDLFGPWVSAPQADRELAACNGFFPDVVRATMHLQYLLRSADKLPLYWREVLEFLVGYMATCVLKLLRDTLSPSNPLVAALPETMPKFDGYGDQDVVALCAQMAPGAFPGAKPSKSKPKAKKSKAKAKPARR